MFYFWIAVKAVSSHCFFSIRGVASATMIAGDMQAMTGVSEMARKLMSACEDAMAIINCLPPSERFDDEASNPILELFFEASNPRLKLRMARYGGSLYCKAT